MVIKRVYKILAVLLLVTGFILTTAYLLFRSPRVQVKVAGWVTKRLSENLNTKISVGGVDISFFDNIILEDVLIEDLSKDTMLYSADVRAQIDDFSIRKRKINIKNVFLWDTRLNLKKDTAGTNFQFFIDSITSGKKSPEKEWQIYFNNVHLRNSKAKFTNLSKYKVRAFGFNPSDIDAENINFSLRNVSRTDSLTTFRIDNVSFREKSGLRLKNLEFNAFIDTVGVGFSEFILNTNLSKLDVPYLIVTPRTFPVDSSAFINEADIYGTPSRIYNYHFNAKFNKSILSLSEVAIFFPKIKGMNEIITFSGNYRGTLDNFKVKDFTLILGERTKFYADIDMKGLPDWDKTFIHFKTENNTIDFLDVASIHLPDHSGKEYLKIPPTLLDSSILTYRGSITGFPSDFVAYGTVDGDLGQISTDIAFKPTEEGAVNYRGRLITKSFKIGKFLNSKSLGEISLKTNLTGTHFGKDDFYAVVDGVIDSLYYNNYRIDAIFMNGSAEERSFDGEISINDENLKFYFEGRADLEPEIPEFNFVSSVEKVNLSALGIDKKYNNTTIAFEVDANFKGTNIDNLEGEINIDELGFVRGENELKMNDLSLVTVNTPGLRSSTFRSDFIDLDIKGQYKLLDFDLSLRDFIKHYLPSVNLPFSDREMTSVNKFNFNLNLKKTTQLSKFFKSDLVVKTPLTAKGKFDSEKNIFDFRCSVPEIMYGDHTIKGVKISSQNINDKWHFRTGIDELSFDDRFEIYNLAFNANASSDSLLSRLTWNNNEALTYSGRIEFLSAFSRNEKNDALRTDLYFKPSNIWIADSLWTIKESSLHIDSSAIVVDNFSFGHKNERIEVNGVVSAHEEDNLGLYFKNIKLRNLNLIAGRDIELDGILNGKAELKDVYDKFLVINNLSLSEFTFRDEVLGDLLLSSSWDREHKNILSDLMLLKNGEEQLKAGGYYKPEAKEVNYSVRFSSLPLDLLFPVFKNFSDGIEGDATGELKIAGNSKSPDVFGEVLVDSASIGIGYTKTNYTFTDKIKFKNNSIVFDNITAYDEEGNTGTFNGTIEHDFFSKMKYNLEFKTDYILAMNTKVEDNDLFYGKVHASGGVWITGEKRKVRLDMSLKSERGSNFALSFENPKSAYEYDFVKFVSDNTFVQAKKRTKKNVSREKALDIYLDIEATPDANVQIIFDSTTGDVIEGIGEGTLRLVYDNEENLYVYGDYTVEKGDYLFTLQNIVNKRFRINRGGTISFNGDPYGAIIDVDGVYRLKASLYDLMMDANYSSRATVDCKINLSQTLYRPAVKFSIDLPSADQRTIDAVEQYISTQDDINRQMLSLLITGTFYTPEYLQGSSGYSSTSSVVGATTSEMLSNQFSNWLSQISNDFDIGFNYRPGDEVNERQVEVALSTQILDDRVTINGNIGNNANLQSNNTSNFVGEVEIFVKLNKTGRVQLKAYNRSNDNYIYYTAPYTQGIGLTFREEFENLEELKKLNKQRRIERKLKRKEKKKKKNATQTSSKE